MPRSDLESMAREMAETLIKMRHDLTDQPTPEYSSATNYNAEYLTLGLKSFARKYAALRLREADERIAELRYDAHEPVGTYGRGWCDHLREAEGLLHRMADEEESDGA